MITSVKYRAPDGLKGTILEQIMANQASRDRRGENEASC